MFAKESRSPGSTPAAQVASLRRRPVKSTAIGAASVTNQQQQQQQQQRSLGLGVSDLAAASTPSMPRRRNVSTALAGGLSSVRSSSGVFASSGGVGTPAAILQQQQQQQQTPRIMRLPPAAATLGGAGASPGKRYFPSTPATAATATKRVHVDSNIDGSSYDVTDIEMIDDSIDEDGYGGNDEADITRGKVFLNTGTTLVQLAGRIPSELSDDFNEAGQSAPGCYAVVHATSGFAAWVTERTCTVWKYNGSIANSNIRTYVLPMPAPSHDSIWSGVPPTVILVNSDSSTSNSDDVGLLAIAQTGEMRYWPSVALGLSGNNQSQYLSARVMLNPDDGDRVTHVVDMSISGGDGLVLVTAGGRLFRLLLINSHNNAELTCTPVVRSTPVVGRATLILMKAAGMAKMALSAGLGKPDIVSELGPVVYASNGAQGDEPRSSELILLTAHTVEKWIVPPANDGSPMRLLCAHEASPLIKSALGGDKFVARLTLLAATAGASNEIIILAKYVPPNPRATEADLINATGVYVLVNLHVSSQTAAVASIRRLNYVPGPIAANHSQNLPLLLVPNGGPGVFVVFADAIVMTAVADIDYYYCIPLEHDVILGAAGTVDQCAAVMLCTGLSNVIRSDIDAARLELRTHDPAAAHRAKLLRSRHNTIQPEQSPSGRSQGKHLDDRQQIQELSEEDRAELYAARVEQLTSLVEQAVHFGQASANPLLFALTNNDIDSIGDDALETAVIAVARSILDSTSEFAPTTLDTKAHLRARFTSMDAIIRFLRARQLLTTEVSPRTRADLLSMTQMLAAAVGLWHVYDELLHDATTDDATNELLTPSVNLLSSAVTAVLGDTVDSETIAQAGGPERYFFTRSVSRIPALIERIASHILPETLSGFTEGTKSHAVGVFDANRLLLGAINGAAEYHAQSGALYDIDDLRNIPVDDVTGWLLSMPMLTALGAQFERAIRLALAPVIKDNTTETNTSVAAESSRPRSGTLPFFADGDDADVDADADVGNMDMDNIDTKDDATAGVYGSNRALHAAIKNQVIDFGDVLLRLSAKRVSALEAFAAATGNHGPSEEARNRHYAACPQVILPLSRVGPRARAAALRLGEEHRAFDALVELLMNPSGSDGVSPSTAAQQKQLAFYVNQFGRDFAFTLYDYFLSKGISSRLLSQPDAHDALVAEFMELRREECESISWLHDVKLGKFASVDQQVTELARTEGEALSKGDLLSFGKLSLLADKPASVLAAASAAAGASPELDEEDLACGSAIRQYDGGIRALDMQSQMVSWAEQRLEERYGGDANDAREKLAALSHDAIVLRAAAVSCDPTLLQRHVHPDAALPELQSTNAANSTVPADYSINGVGALVGVSGWTGLAAWYACLFATAAEGITLTIDDLTDLVTLAALDGDSTLATPAQRGLRFARLLRIIFENSADPAMPVPVIEYAVRTVWRRMFLQDDWASLAPLTSRLSAQDLNDAVEHTTLYHFVHECHKLGLGGHRNMFSDPYSCAHGLAEDDVHARIARHRSACDDEMKANVEVHGWANDIFAGLEEESAQIEQLCDKARLVDFYNLVGDLLRPKLVADVNATAANIADAMDEDM